MWIFLTCGWAFYACAASVPSQLANVFGQNPTLRPGRFQKRWSNAPFLDHILSWTKLLHSLYHVLFQKKQKILATFGSGVKTRYVFNMNTAKKTAATPTFSQAQVELATGFSREVLRKWELRFGFPHPTRDGRERRLYSLSDLQRLQLIKQLLQTGHRPRHLLPLPAEALHHLMASSTVADVATPSPISKAVLKILAGSPTPADLDTYLRARLDKVGLAAFAVNDLPVLNEAIGNAWANGSLGVHGEHF
jgi:hypothetical protein